MASRRQPEPTLEALVAAAVAAALPAAIQAAMAATPAAESGKRSLRSADGRDFPCTAPEPCSRMLRSKGRAAIHGVDAGGHEPRR